MVKSPNPTTAITDLNFRKQHRIKSLYSNINRYKPYRRYIHLSAFDHSQQIRLMNSCCNVDAISDAIQELEIRVSESLVEDQCSTNSPKSDHKVDRHANVESSV